MLLEKRQAVKDWKAPGTGDGFRRRRDPSWDTGRAKSLLPPDAGAWLHRHRGCLIKLILAVQGKEPIMAARRYTVVCAWCQRIVATASGGDGVTHTICESCFDWTLTHPSAAVVGAGADAIEFPPRERALFSDFLGERRAKT